MGWLRDWKRKRVLARHSVDDALWDKAAGSLPFLAGYGSTAWLPE